MAKIVLEEVPEFVTFPADTILELKIEEANVKTVSGRNGDWEKCEFKFKILGIQATGDGSPKENYDPMITGIIWGSVPFRLNDNAENKLRQWAEAIFQMELGVGFELDTDLFVGRQVRGITSQYASKSRDAQGNPIMKHQVEMLLPKSGSTPQTQASVAQAAAQPVGASAASGSGWDTPGSSAPAAGWDDEPPF